MKRWLSPLVLILLLSWASQASEPLCIKKVCPQRTGFPVYAYAAQDKVANVRSPLTIHPQSTDPVAPPMLGATWFTETVRSTGSEVNAGLWTSLQLDGFDRPHISYGIGGEDYDLEYAYYDGVSWITQTVDTAGYVFACSSLALDPAGRPHISYGGFSGLRYAHYSGTEWITESLDVRGGWEGTSLALDATGHPHISYYDQYSFDLKCAHYDGNTWQLETVDSVGHVGRHSSLAIDSDGQPHISYRDSTNQFLKYAHYDGIGWDVQVIDSAGQCESTSLILDNSDHPHISYCDNSNSLKYTYLDAGGWHFETVTSDSQRYSSLVLDTSNLPHIAYCLSASGECTALRYTKFDGAAWQIETVEESPGGTNGPGWYTSLALDTAGWPHISYHYGSDSTQGGNTWTKNAAEWGWGTLRYAVLCAPINSLSVNGPPVLPIGEAGHYTAAYKPITATPPIALSWDNGTDEPTAVYSWTLPGEYTITLTAASYCTEITTTFLVRVRLHTIYLPAIGKPWWPNPSP